MIRFKQIELLAKKLASRIIKDKKVEPTDKIMKKVIDVLGKEQADKILETINNPSFSKENKVTTNFIEDSKKHSWKVLEPKLPKTSKLVYIKTFSKVAAIFICTLGAAYGYYNFDNKIDLVKPTQVKRGDITLKLDNGAVEIISENGERKIVNQIGEVVGNQKGSNLNYSTVAEVSSNKTKEEITKTTEKLKFNELTIPNGKKFQLVLSDGTKVHLNSGSSIKYPIKFLKGMERKVSITGEAYFDVAKDKEHPFIVAANDLNVRVLGTQFNISSYPEDDNVNTVLVEGSVSLYNKNQEYKSNTSTLLKPGKKATWSKDNKRIRMENVNTDFYTDWTQGKISFEHLEFGKIIRKLERHFDIKISCNNQKLYLDTFTATFYTETIEQVLQSFAKNTPFSYTMKENQITIH
jgi:hypothetical protein